MDFKPCTRLYFYFFYLIGVSPYHPTTKSKLILCFKISKYIQFVVSQFCCLAGLILLNRNGLIPEFTHAQALILSILAVGASLRSSFLLMQCILFKQIMIDIIKLLEELEQFFSRCLQHQICYQEFVKQYRQSVSFVIVFQFVQLSVLTRMLFVQVGMSNTLSVLFSILHIMTTLSYLHSMFFITLMRFCLAQLNLVVVSDMKWSAGGIRNDRPIRKRLEYYKIAYFRVWTISQRVNRFFGYSWITTSFYTFCFAVYSVFWAYQYSSLVYLYSKFVHKEMFKQGLTRLFVASIPLHCQRYGFTSIFCIDLQLRNEI